MFITASMVIPHRRDRYCLYLKTIDGVFRLTPWRSNFACHKWQHGQWLDWARDPGLLLFPREPGDGGEWQEHCLDLFYGAIPEKAVKISSGLRWMQFSALRLMRRNPRASDLAADNPALFWTLAKAIGWGELGLSEAAHLVDQRRRNIVERLFVGQDVSERCLRKIRGQRYDFEEYSVLMVLAGHKLLSVLRDIPRLELQELTPLAGCPQLASCAFFQRMLREGDCEEHRVQFLKGIVTDCLAMEREMGVANAWDGLRRCASVDALLKRHGRIVRKFNDQGEMEKRLRLEFGEIFPEPPLGGNGSIEPITTLTELRKEGERMRHCVLSLAPGVFAGELAVYRVMGPERATLAVRVDMFRCHIQEFALSDNAEPGPDSWSSVLQWIESATTRKIWNENKWKAIDAGAVKGQEGGKSMLAAR